MASEVALRPYEYVMLRGTILSGFDKDVAGVRRFARPIRMLASDGLVRGPAVPGLFPRRWAGGPRR